MKFDARALKGLSGALAPSAGGGLADRALAEGFITPEQFESCVREQEACGRPADQILVERGHLTAAQAARLRPSPIPPEAERALQDPALRLGHYVRVERIGEGGMAEVWKSWDLSLGRWVAVKVLRPEVGQPTRRIEREGRAAGGLSHPNIMPIYERGTHEGRPYLVMPHVDARPPSRPLAPREAARVAREVALALAHAHGRGIIHRDVKPGNVLVGEGGRVLLADFGLAVAEEAGGSPFSVSGTPEFASPEQLRGDPLDGRTDVYSLGVTLRHLVGGPMPSALAAVVTGATRPDARLRTASASEMAEQLGRFLSPGPASQLLRPAAIGMALLAAALAAGVTYVTLSLHGERERAEQVGENYLRGMRALMEAEQEASQPKPGAARVIEAASRAIPLFLEAVHLAGGVQPDATARLGRCYELMGQDARAEEAYGRATSDPLALEGLARIWFRRGAALEAEGRKAEAAAAFAKAISLAPEGLPLRAALERALKERRK
jgi:hypothetical protein